MKQKLCLVITLLMLNASCVPALIVGGVAANSSKRKSRGAWSAEFHKTNMEREKAGLKPLDFCEEAYKFDPKWVKKHPDCRDYLKK